MSFIWPLPTPIWWLFFNYKRTISVTVNSYELKIWFVTYNKWPTINDQRIKYNYEKFFDSLLGEIFIFLAFFNSHYISHGLLVFRIYYLYLRSYKLHSSVHFEPTHFYGARGLNEWIKPSITLKSNYIIILALFSKVLNVGNIKINQ